MTDYGIVKSEIRPEAKVVDEYSVYIAMMTEVELE